MVYCYDGKGKHEKVLPIPPTCFFSNNNGFQVLMCHHAVRKDTHADLQRILRHAMNYGCGSAIRCNEYACNEFFGLQCITDAAARSCARNYGCWHAIVRSEKTHTLARNEFFGVQWITDAAVRSCAMNFRKDTHAGLQRIPSAGCPSCDQKRHTRWHATNSGWWCGHTRWHATNSGWCCALVPSETCQRMLGFKEFRVKQN